MSRTDQLDQASSPAVSTTSSSSPSVPAVLQHGSSRRLVDAKSATISAHLAYRPLPELAQVFDPESECEAYHGEITTAYGVQHPKEFIRNFQKRVLWTAKDVNNVLFHFINSSALYQQYDSFNTLADTKSEESKLVVDSKSNPIYKLHIKNQIKQLSKDSKIAGFAQVKYLLDDQFPKIRKAIRSKNQAFQEILDHFSHLETILEHKTFISDLNFYDEKKLDSLQVVNPRLKINLYVQLSDALSHIEICAKKRKLVLTEDKASVEIKIDDVTLFVGQLLPALLKKAYNFQQSEGIDLNGLYTKVKNYLGFLRQDVEKLIKGSEKLAALDTSRKIITELFSQLNISTFPLVDKGVDAIAQDYSQSYVKRSLAKMKSVLMGNLRIPPEQFSVVTQGLINLVTPQDAKQLTGSASSLQLPQTAVSPNLSSTPPSLLKTYTHWFASIYSACLDFIASYEKLLLLVQVNEESTTDWHQTGLAKKDANLFTAKSRATSAFVFLSATYSKGQLVEPQRVLEVERTVEDQDLLCYLKTPGTDTRAFADCLTVKQQERYIVELTKLVLAQSIDLSGYIALKRTQILGATTSKSDAFILRVPTNPNSMTDIQDLVSPHEYARGLVSEFKSDPRFGLVCGIINFADLYFRLVYKTHFLQYVMGSSTTLNDSGDSAILSILNNSTLRDEVKLFLELVAKAEAAALGLKEILVKLSGEQIQRVDSFAIALTQTLNTFLDGIKEFDKSFEPSCNRPTSAGFGLFENSKQLKQIYSDLYVVFTYFRVDSRRSGLLNDKNGFSTSMKKPPKSLLEVSIPAMVVESKSSPAAKKQGTPVADPKEELKEVPSTPIPPVLTRAQSIPAVYVQSPAPKAVVKQPAVEPKSSDTDVPPAPPLLSGGPSMLDTQSESPVVPVKPSTPKAVVKQPAVEPESTDTGVPPVPPLSQTQNVTSSSSSISGMELMRQTLAAKKSEQEQIHTDVPPAPPLPSETISNTDIPPAPPLPSTVNLNSASVDAESKAGDTTSRASSTPPTSPRPSGGSTLFSAIQNGAKNLRKTEDAKKSEGSSKKPQAGGGLSSLLQGSMLNIRKDVGSDDESEANDQRPPSPSLTNTGSESWPT